MAPNIGNLYQGVNMRKLTATLLILLSLASSINVFAEEQQQEEKDNLNTIGEIDKMDETDQIEDLEGIEEVSIYDIAYSDVFTYEETVLPYRYILPEDYNSENKYPVILFLHAKNESGTDNVSQLRHCVDYLRKKAPQSIIVAPQCSPDNQWVDVPIENGNYSVSEVPESNELRAVVALLEKVQTDFSIDSKNISVVGVSMGGYGAWDLLMRHNEIFTAGVILCGGGDPTQAELLKDTPIYIFHGVDDEVVSIDVAKEMITSIIDVGGTKARFFAIQNSDHSACYELYFGKGVIESLSRSKVLEKEPEEDLSNSNAEVVKDAGIRKGASKMQFIFLIMVPFVFGVIFVVFVLKKVKF